MSLENAKNFVSRMQEDTKFRDEVKNKPDGKTQKLFLQQSGYEFEERELVIAMARCMEEMAFQGGSD